MECKTLFRPEEPGSAIGVETTHEEINERYQRWLAEDPTRQERLGRKNEDTELNLSAAIEREGIEDVKKQIDEALGSPYADIVRGFTFTPMKAWNLRRATAADHDFLYALHKETMRDHVAAVWGWEEEQQIEFFNQRFQPEHWQVIQHWADGRWHDVGVLIVDETDDQIYVAEIQVLPGWQGKGTGSYVLSQVMHDAASKDKPVTLRALHVNERARALYEKLGFRGYKKDATHVYLGWMELTPAAAEASYKALRSLLTGVQRKA